MLCIQVLTLPTLLTLGRMAAIPVLVAAWFARESTACTALFVAAALTDWLDGYLARKLVRWKGGPLLGERSWRCFVAAKMCGIHS
jgi:phosphatidylglycerophosphate synthase